MNFRNKAVPVSFVNKWFKEAFIPSTSITELCIFTALTNVTYNMKTKKGWSSLICAADEGNVDCLSLLLENGADKNRKDFEEKTPEEVAREMGHFAIAELVQ